MHVMHTLFYQVNFVKSLCGSLLSLTKNDLYLFMSNPARVQHYDGDVGIHDVNIAYIVTHQYLTVATRDYAAPQMAVG